MRIIALVILLISLSSSCWSSQEAQVKEANSFFKQQKWDEAIDRYLNALEQSKNNDIVRYDLGAAFYKKGNYDQSIEHLQKAEPKKDKKLMANTQYNLGNAFYQKGRSLEQKDIDGAIKSMQESLSHYEKTLNLNAKDEDASYNYKIVEEEIKRLQKKKQQQPSHQQNQQQKDQSQENKQNNQNLQQNQSSKSPESQQQQDQQKKEGSQQQQQSKEEQKETKPESQQQNQLSVKPEDGDKKQAKQMLEDYEQNEAPKGLLNFKQRDQGDVHVDKDW